VVGGVVAGPSVLSACGGGTGQQATDTFKAGAVLELSGASATGGQIARRGYQLWADTVNSKGGLSVGHKKYNVDLVVQDCKSDPATGADATSRLVTEEGVNAIFGTYTSGVQIAMDPICAKYKVPCIAGSADSPGIWAKQPAFTFGVIPAVDTTANRSIQSIVDIANPRPATAAVVGANEPFSDDTANGFRSGPRVRG
jgi:branched-chain amino acid transport system substrate-binding protein